MRRKDTRQDKDGEQGKDFRKRTEFRTREETIQKDSETGLNTNLQLQLQSRSCKFFT